MEASIYEAGGVTVHASDSSVQVTIIARSPILQILLAYCRNDQLLFDFAQITRAATCPSPILFGARRRARRALSERTRGWGSAVGIVQFRDEGYDKKTLKKFEKCLKKHGVKISLPVRAGRRRRPSGTFPSGGGAPGASRLAKKFQKAIKACSLLLPAGSQFGGGTGSPPNGSTAFAAFRNCMTLHHVTLQRDRTC